MSIDLAVWEGSPPSSHKEALETYLALYERYVASDDETPPTPAIAAYVAALLERYPDRTADDSVGASPWSDSPLISDAIGPFFYFAFVRNALLDEAWTHAVDTARSMGLVSFDPQSERLA